MIEAVAFDVDGVLVRAGVFAEILEEQHGLDRAATAGFFQGPFKDCVLGRADLGRTIEPFLRDWGWPGSVQDCLDQWFEADAGLNSDVLDLIPAIRSTGRRCYVASTQEQHRATYLETQLGLGELFDGLFFSCRARCSKPDRAFFEHVTDAIGVAPRQVLFFDDHEANVEGAQAAGWNAELYAFGDDIGEMLARHGVSLTTSRS